MNFKVNISTDRESYKSKDKANITMIIESSGDLDNVSVKVYGVKAKGKFKLNKAEIVNLTQGKNIKSMIIFVRQIPKSQKLWA